MIQRQTPPRRTALDLFPRVAGEARRRIPHPTAPRPFDAPSLPTWDAVIAWATASVSA